MAKQASNKTKSSNKSMAKIVIPIKSEKTGHYSFKEEMILLDQLNEKLSKYAK